MILDNSCIDYSRMLLFMFDFFVYWKIEVLAHSRASGNTWFMTLLQSCHVKAVKKTNVTSQTTILKILLQ